METLLCVMLILYWHTEGTVARVFSHTWWDTYVLFKFWSEVIILSLMLYILQSRFATTSNAAPAGYVRVPNVNDDDDKNATNV